MRWNVLVLVGMGYAALAGVFAVLTLRGLSPDATYSIVRDPLVVLIGGSLTIAKDLAVGTTHAARRAGSRRRRGTGAHAGLDRREDGGKQAHDQAQGDKASDMLVATVNFPFVATENRTLCWLAVAGLRSTLLSKPTARRQVADARMGDEDAAEALSGTGRLEGGVGEALRGESPDAPRVDRVEPVGPGPVVRGRTVFAAAARTAQAGPLRRDHRFPSRGVPRAVSEAAVRRGPRGWLRR